MYVTYLDEPWNNTQIPKLAMDYTLLNFEVHGISWHFELVAYYSYPNILL